MKLIVLLLLCSLSTQAQFITNGGVGLTNTHFSGEMQVGYKVKFITASAGYTSLQFAADQPVIFNVRIGCVIEKLHLYAGKTKVMYSTDDRRKNYGDWQVGGQYCLIQKDKGSLYTGVTYSKKFFTVTIGIAYNLFKNN